MPVTSRVILVLLFLAACESAVPTTEPTALTTSEAVKTADPTQPAYSHAVLIQDTRPSDAEPLFYHPGIAGSACSNWVTTFATERTVEDVVAFYDRQGFESLGQPPGPAMQDGRMVRWIAVREGDEETCRKVDVATGEIAGHPEWTTVFELKAPNCDTPRGSGDEPGAVQPAEPAPLAPPRRCEAEPGSPLNLEGEPDWSQLVDYVRWTDREGCMVRIDVLVERIGDAHCGWEDARVIVTGSPLGSRHTGPGGSLNYVKDPLGVYGMRGLMEGFRVLDELPADAVNTGYRQGERGLWLSPGVPGAAYVRSPDGVERWPEGQPPLCF